MKCGSKEHVLSRPVVSPTARSPSILIKIEMVEGKTDHGTEVDDQPAAAAEEEEGEEAEAGKSDGWHEMKRVTK